MAIYKRIHRALGRPIGASAVEYLVAMILVVLVVLATIRVFGDTVKSRFTAGTDTISTMDKEQSANAAGASSKGGGKAAADGSGTGGSSAAATTYKTEDERQQALLAKEAKKNQKAKFTPLILLVFVGLIGLLLFVVMRGNSYS
jgi:Flp pilus assembly pilin Flp